MCKLKTNSNSPGMVPSAYCYNTSIYSGVVPPTAFLYNSYGPPYQMLCCYHSITLIYPLYSGWEILTIPSLVPLPLQQKINLNLPSLKISCFIVQENKTLTTSDVYVFSF